MHRIKITEKTFKGYHSVSFDSIIDSYFNHYATCCMASLKVMIKNSAFSATKFEISNAEFFPLNYTKRSLKRLDQHLENNVFVKHPKKYFSVPKAI